MAVVCVTGQFEISPDGGGGLGGRYAPAGTTTEAFGGVTGASCPARVTGGGDFSGGGPFFSGGGAFDGPLTGLLGGAFSGGCAFSLESWLLCGPVFCV